VRDTGCGISQQDQAKLFVPFTMLSANKNLNPNGTGMGLSICKRIAESMGGAVWVESQEGRGSTFGFSLRCELPDNSQIEEMGLVANVIDVSNQMPRNIKEIFDGHEPYRKIYEDALRHNSEFEPVKNVRQQIIVADDQKFVINAMKALLSNIFMLNSYVVTYVRDGKQALDYVR